MNGLSLLLIRAILALVVLVASVAPGVAQEVVEYIHTDALGSPVAITDVNGQVIERTVYEPYGAVVNRPLTDGPGYTGHVTDSETGLSYMQQRYMDPAVGALLSVDPVTVEGGDMRHLNRYAYAYNNPYKFKDPDGRCPQCLWGGGAPML
ncbi:TPA: RHS repeat domain-containing protein [Stenotrophomonas maltophilia]|uniref:RHS repeat domain-containing protein n=1 Tax=Stenotrophomonas forensis TaxID=2871169 RepID=UPI0038C89502